MLCEITIENVAVIEKATATFDNGFTVLTGETGAGKSILIDSINAILGNRISRDIVRNGAAKAKIWATFRGIGKATVAQLEHAGYTPEEELLLYREVTTDGKSSCRINGMPATAAILRDVCSNMINIHGQHDNQSLLNPAKHLDILDAFAQNETCLAEYALQYNKLLQLRHNIKSISMNEDEKNRRLELLRYQVDEIEQAELAQGEEEQLLERREVVRNAQTIIQALHNTYFFLSGDDEQQGASSYLRDATNEITTAARFSQELEPFADTLNELYYSSVEMASEIQNRLSHYDFDTSTLDELEQRLDILYKLKQKYGASVEEVMAYGEKSRLELETIEFSAERLEELTSQEALQVDAVQTLADQLSDSRRMAFEQLNGQIAKALDFLNMPGIVMALRMDTVSFAPTGQDDVEFYISTNAGEQPKPLAKIASGGELSRIMLAMKSALADRDEIATVIYDEVDTGISGLAAGRIGKMLRFTAKGRQVICVTHTAQVAAYATQHLLISKKVEEGRTFTSIQELDEKGRINELARVISGDKITDIARANAEEMLRIASAPPKK